MPSASTLKGNLFTCQVFLANDFFEPATKPGQPTLHAPEVLKTHASHLILSGGIRSEGAFEKIITRQDKICTKKKEEWHVVEPFYVGSSSTNSPLSRRTRGERGTRSSTWTWGGTWECTPLQWRQGN